MSVPIGSLFCSVPFLIYTYAIGHAETVIFGTGVAQAEVEVDGEAARQRKLVAHGQSCIPHRALIAGVF